MATILSSKTLALLVIFCLSMEIYTFPVELTAFKEQEQTTKPQIPMSAPVIPYSVTQNGQGAVYDWQNDKITIRLAASQTQGSFTLTEDAMKPTFALGLHMHRKHTETFHVLEGELEFRLGKNTQIARAGTTIHVPSNIPHGVRVINGRPARMLMLFAPGGFENVLKEMKTFTDAQFADEKFMKAFNEKHDNIILE
ncbi:unnamed protein product [Rotaria socialis]|uniref:Cupin type-2 domain-containing protein n=1 Tax=Rotaria socialis TaxID=392032 RepID=A0A818VXC8_9BILA|nr:unnamed protein product [Rotaria socialis]CAF4600335.1 unnamed protein product [Rotaria socialis]